MSTELIIVKREMEKAAINGLQSWPLWEFSKYEKALGYAAFSHWLVKGLTFQEKGLGYDYFENPNETARGAAAEFILNHVARAPVSNFIIERIPSFNPVEEAALALAKSGAGKRWETSLTRSAIILCSEMSYLYTGMQGERLTVPDYLDFSEAGREWIEEVFGTVCAEELLGKRRIAEIQELMFKV